MIPLSSNERSFWSYTCRGQEEVEHVEGLLAVKRHGNLRYSPRPMIAAV
jgi:hypothetical protein